VKARFTQARKKAGMRHERLFHVREKDIERRHALIETDHLHQRRMDIERYVPPLEKTRHTAGTGKKYTDIMGQVAKTLEKFL
jgi:hypothetical protein